MDRRGLVSVWEDSAEQHPDQTAYRQCGREHDFREYSYAGLVRSAKALAARLSEAGVGQRDHVALLVRESPEWVIATVACFYLDAVVIPVGSNLRKAEIEHILDHSESDYLILDEGLQHKLAEINPELIPRTASLRAGETKQWQLDEPPVAELDPYNANPSGLPSVETPEIEPDQLALIVYTSGTTSKAKGVMLTHRNILYDAEASLEVFVLEQARERYLSVLPMSHMFEFTAGLVCMSKVAAQVTVAHSLASRELGFLIRESSPTLLVAVPLLFRKLKKGIEDKLESLPALLKPLLLRNGSEPRRLMKYLIRKRLGGALELVVTGGAAIEPEVLEFYRDLGIDPLQGYGLTETSPVAAVTRRDELHLGSIGKAIPGVEMRLFDVDEEGVGEIGIRGPNVMEGYYRDPAATGEALEDGWFLTGDLATVDSEGYFWFKGRSKNLIITDGGENIFPEEIAHKLELSELFEESAVFGYKPEGEAESQVAALIVPDREAIAGELGKPGPEALTDTELHKAVAHELRECQKDLANYKRIRIWRLYDGELPRTATRKVIPRECRSILGQILADEATDSVTQARS